MAIKTIVTKSLGIIIADINEVIEDSNSYKLTDVANIQLTEQGARIVPLNVLELVEEKELVISKDDLLSRNLYTPIKEIYNEYTRMYSNGIQLTTQQSIIT